MTEKPTSKRLATQKRNATLGFVGFLVVAGASMFDPIAGGITAGAFTLLAGLLGYTGKAYGDNETQRPSGTPAEPSPLDHLPTPEAR